MVTPELVSYLERCVALGVKKEQAMSSLLAAGWRLPHIQEGYKIIEARERPMNRPQIVLPTLHLSVSLLFILVLGAGTTVLALNFVSQAPLSGRLQANVAEGVAPIVAIREDGPDLLVNQINQISDITDALEIYKELTGFYPKSLADLRKTGNELLASTSGTIVIPEHNLQYLRGLYGERSLYDKELTDLFSNGPFLYSATADDYSLSYLLRWDGTKPAAIEKEFVNGWNTATKDSFSTLRHD